MEPLRILFSQFRGIGFYELAPQHRKRAKGAALSRWVVLKPPDILWLRLPESQANHWKTAALRVTGLSESELQQQGVEILDRDTGRRFTMDHAS